MSDYMFPSLSADEAVRLLSDDVLLLDVRKAPARAAAGREVVGAVWRDPHALGPGDPLLGERRRAVVYCVHGHEVSHYGAALLRLHGIEAWVVRGGFEALAAAGAPLRPIA